MSPPTKAGGRGRDSDSPFTITMDTDYRIMLLVVLARTERLILEVEAIMRETTNSETVEGAMVQLAELRRLMSAVEQKLNRLDDQ